MNRNRLLSHPAWMVVACLACGGKEEVRDGSELLASLPLPCEQQGYPCTWNEVDSAITTRTQLLATIAAR